MLIVIEGIDGSGKTTQTKLLIQRLRADGHRVGTLKFPQYNLFFGKTIKKLLKGELGELKTINHHLASCLYAFDRFQGKPTLLTLLKHNDMVILQRYTTSNEMFQSVKEPRDKRLKFCKWLEKMEYDSLGLPKPNLVIYLYLPTRLCYTLMKKRGGRYELYEKNFKYLNETNNFGRSLAVSRKNWILVECNRENKILSKSEIGEKIWNIVQKSSKRKT